MPSASGGRHDIPYVAPNYPPATWRLILDGQADGATNMAIDAAILEAVLAGSSPATLRFYKWSPPCLSLGRNQPLADADLEACRQDGVDVARRPTGGRAILHTDELTYSIALLETDPRATGDVKESYRRLSEGLLSGLLHLGADIAQAMEQHKPPTEQSAVCFERPSDYEITAGGRKLVGSAQWRARGGILQHGTLPLEGDIARVVQYLDFSEDARKEQREALRARATTLYEAMGRTVSFIQVTQALAAGFTDALNLRLVSGTLTEREQALASALRKARYTNWNWTARS